jgi:ABC-type polysaccharide/polyol phosphate export permease
MTALFAILKETCVKRGLIQKLAVKDLKLRYSRPLLGTLWTLPPSFLIVRIFDVIFRKALEIRTEGGKSLALGGVC